MRFLSLESSEVNHYPHQGRSRYAVITRQFLVHLATRRGDTVATTSARLPLGLNLEWDVLIAPQRGPLGDVPRDPRNTSIVPIRWRDGGSAADSLYVTWLSVTYPPELVT